MSTFECKVYELTISEHPNADVIELAQVGDYRSIVKKGDFKTGDLGVYIPEAAIVPDWLLEKMGLDGKLAGKKKNRVKAIKLRGILSQGLVYPVRRADDSPEPVYRYSIAGENGSEMWANDDADIAGFLGIEKYEPVIPTSMNGEVFNAFGMTLKFDIENIKKFPDVFKENEIVSFTEKLHGTWCCMGYHPENDFPIVTSKGLSDKGLAFKFNEANEKNLYVRMYNRLTDVVDGESVTILDKFRVAYNYVFKGKDVGAFYILGEVFGAGVQDLTYGALPTEFRIFDIFVGPPGSCGQYLDSGMVETICKQMGVEFVPCLYRGPFSKEVLAKYTDGKETASGTGAHMREGVVVRPAEERRHNEIGRVILKSVSEKYLLRRNATEYT